MRGVSDIDPDAGAYRPVPLVHERVEADAARDTSAWFRDRMARRRSVRQFSPEPVPYELVANAVATAATAPSGAHMQPWTFVVVGDALVKARIRAAAEEEERRSYDGRLGEEWLRALRPLGTDANKTHLTDAPWLVVVFAQAWHADDAGARHKHYYATESVGIACGLLLASLHLAGLATLTHTPSPMGFLRTVLDRPANERPYLLIPVGYPAADAVVPDLRRKSLEEVLVRV
jgi:nitroreductase